MRRTLPILAATPVAGGLLVGIPGSAVAASVAGSGGGVSATGTTGIEASTFDQNGATPEGGALSNDGGVLLTSTSTIDVDLAATGGAIFSAAGTAAVLHVTISDDDSGLYGRIGVADRQLAALAARGDGIPQTREPRTGSPAIDAGPTAPRLPADQNGLARPDGDAASAALCEPGAVEVVGGAVPPDLIDPDPIDPTDPDPSDPTGPQGPTGSAATPTAGAAPPVRAQPNDTGCP